MRHLAALLAAFAACSALGCTTYEDDLNRSQRGFDQNEHERALAIMRQLDSDQGRLSTSDRAHYFYLRGMTDYRIGYRLEARHWLGLAAAMENTTPGSLPPDSVKRLQDALKELNEAVYNGGIQALNNDATKGKPADDVEESPHDSKASETSPDKGDDGHKREKGDDAAPKKKATDSP